MRLSLHTIICIVCLWPRISGAYDYYSLYSISFEAPYHTIDTAVAVASNVSYAPSSVFKTFDTDGPMVRNHTGTQTCEFRWSGSTGTMSEVRSEQIRLDLPQIPAIRVDFTVFIPSTSTNYLEDYFEFTVLMDTHLSNGSGFANQFDFRGDGQFWNGALIGSYQTGVWHNATIIADLISHTYEFILDDVPVLNGSLPGENLYCLRFNLRDRFGKGQYSVYIDNLSVSAAHRPTAYDIGNGNVKVVDSDPYLIYGTSTVNTITVNTGVVADITISNLNVQVTNRFECAFNIASNAAVNLTLIESNYLMSGRYEAALHVPLGASVSITNGDSTGSLTAIGGGQGPGIGGRSQTKGGEISIFGGIISAIGGFGAAGIGCGDFGMDGGFITIAGGTVVAQGGGIGEGGCGAGIGGGNASAGGVITITGGKVTATGGVDTWAEAAGAGIGGGHTKPGGLITITGGTVFAMRGTQFWGASSATDIGAGGATPEIGTNIFTGGSIKTSANSIWGAPVDANSNAIYLLIVSNAVDGTNSIDISFTNMQTGAIYSYIGAGHGDGDHNLYFYLPLGDYPADSEETLGYFVNADGTFGSMTHNPADWSDELRTISGFSVNSGAHALTLAHPLGTYSDGFRIEGADKVEENSWNWSTIPHTADVNGVITIYTNTPSLMLRIHY